MRKPTHPIHAEIKKLKNHLKTEAEQHGVSENFGEQVVRRLRDRYFNARFDKLVGKIPADVMKKAKALKEIAEAGNDRKLLREKISGVLAKRDAAAIKKDHVRIGCHLIPVKNIEALAVELGV